MAPFYTGKGDTGNTGFLGEGRISKTSARIEAIGSVDEANAALGLARSLTALEAVSEIILRVQKQLYILMTELSTDDKTSAQFSQVSAADVDWLEGEIKIFEKKVKLPREFIVPGENQASGALALARTIIRRAERRTIAFLEEQGSTKSEVVAYLNRLSSLVFLLEVYETTHSGPGVRLVKAQ